MRSSSAFLLHVLAVSLFSNTGAYVTKIQTMSTTMISENVSRFKKEVFANPPLGRELSELFAAREEGESMGVANVSKLTVFELKEKLRQNNLSVDGRKRELIERLHHHFLNQNSIDIDQREGEMDNEFDSSSGDKLISVDLDSLTVPLLKERLRGLGLPVGGRKAELVERLQSSLFGKSNGMLAGTQITGERIVNDDISSRTDSNRSSHVDIVDGISDCEEGEEDKDDNQNESESSRRARRKQFLMTQEVRKLIKAKDPRTSLKAEEMITTLEKIAKQENNDAYLPGPIQYTLLIDAYAKSDAVDATHRAEAVIDRLLNENSSTGFGLYPTLQMMYSIMATYANVASVEGATKATAILERMEYLKEFGQLVKPTVHSYSIAISAWAKCGSVAAAENAESILNRLFDVYDELLSRGDSNQYAEELKPNNIVFNSVIDAW